MEDSRVRLMWKVTSWTSDLEGFAVKRRVKPDSAWQSIGPKVIYPGYYDREWADYGVSVAEKSRVASALDSYTKSGVNPLPVRQAIERLQEYGSVPVGTQLSYNRKYLNAIVGGFGLIDSDLDGESYLYGLFPVFSGQRIAEVPVSTFSAQDYIENTKQSANELKAIYQNGECRITWALAPEVYEAVGIIGYKIYVKDSVGSDFVALFERPMWRGEKDDGGYLQFEHIDSVSPQRTDIRIYAVEAHTAFGRALPRKEVICEVHPRVRAPHSLRHSRLQDRAYELSWKMPEINIRVEGLVIDVERVIIEDFNALSEYEKLSGEVTSKPYEVVGYGMPIDAKSWIDDLRVRESTRVSYRIRIRNSDGENLATSSSALASITPNILPPPVENLKAILMPSPRKSGLVVRLQWDYPAEFEGLIRHFSVSSGESIDRLVRHASHNLSERFFERQLNSQGNEYFFRVVPVAENRLQGEPRDLSLYLPKTRLDPFPRGSRVEYEPHLNDLVSTIRWEYGDRTDLSGFRIRHLKTDEIIADTDEIGPDASEWVWRGEALQRESSIPIQIEAVGVFDYITSLPREAYLNNGLHMVRNYSLPETEIRSANVFRHNDKKLLALEWDAWEEELYREVQLLGIGPAKADKYTPIPLYRIGWHQYIESENGKLVVEIPDYLDLSGEVDMRLVPLYEDGKGHATIKGRFAEFTVNLDETNGGGSESQEDTVAESLVPLEQSLKWETRLIEEEAGLTDEFMAGIFEFQNIGDTPIEMYSSGK